ncbi:hypothetical protein [Pseudomonas sp. Z1-6]|uniref:hypothetical protein n=1 Tax=Pseudomonas sp. Z1-6 TaxID=2817407 RepID=UPI003DA9B7B8
MWSKYRVKDARPTVGVTSEITHPVDLACYIAGVSTAATLRSTSSIICESDFVQGGMQRPETMLACVDFADGMVLTGISSYIRSERCRTMEFVLSDATSNVTEIAVLRLDSPKWDDDYLTVFSTVSGASPLDLMLSHVTPPNKNRPRRQIDKICRFLEDVISSIKGAGSPGLPNKSQALLVQDIVRRLEDGHTVSRKMFSDEAPVPRSDGLIRLKELAVLMKSGASEEMRNDWNDQY